MKDNKVLIEELEEIITLEDNIVYNEDKNLSNGEMRPCDYPYKVIKISRKALEEHKKQEENRINLDNNDVYKKIEKKMEKYEKLCKCGPVQYNKETNEIFCNRCGELVESDFLVMNPEYHTTEFKEKFKEAFDLINSKQEEQDQIADVGNMVGKRYFKIVKRFLLGVECGLLNEKNVDTSLRDDLSYAINETNYQLFKTDQIVDANKMVEQSELPCESIWHSNKEIPVQKKWIYISYEQDGCFGERCLLFSNKKKLWEHFEIDWHSINKWCYLDDLINSKQLQSIPSEESIKQKPVNTQNHLMENFTENWLKVRLFELCEEFKNYRDKPFRNIVILKFIDELKIKKSSEMNKE